MHIRKILLSLGTLLLGWSVSSQEIILSQQELIQKVLDNNIELRIADESYNLRKADFLQSRAMYYPNINLNYTGMSTNSPLMAFGTKLNQAVVVQEDFFPDLLNNPSSIQNFSLQLQVQQPILNFDKKHEREAAFLTMDAALMQKERTVDYLSFEASKLYMQLQLAYRAIDVINQAIETAMANQAHAQNSYEVGYLLEADLLEVEVRISELKNQLLSTEHQIKDISDQMHTLMQDGHYNTIRPAEELLLTAEDLPTTISDARADYRAMDKSFAAYNEMLKSSEKSFLPRLNAFGTFETNDDNPINAGATNYLVGMQISWNIFDGHQRSAKVQRSRAQLEKTRLEKEKYMLSNQKEFLKALRMYNQATAKLSTVRLAMKNAKESLRIRSNRLAQGLEKTSDVLMAETKYSEQKLLEYQTIFEINFAKLYARFLSE